MDEEWADLNEGAGRWVRTNGLLSHTHGRPLSTLLESLQDPLSRSEVEQASHFLLLSGWGRFFPPLAGHYMVNALPPSFDLWSGRLLQEAHQSGGGPQSSHSVPQRPAAQRTQLGQSMAPAHPPGPCLGSISAGWSWAGRWPCHLASVAGQPGALKAHPGPGNRSTALPGSPLSWAFQHLPIHQDPATAVNPSTHSWKGRKGPSPSNYLSGLNCRRPFWGHRSYSYEWAPWWEGFFFFTPFSF